MLNDPKRLYATQMLVMANACWALSFPTVKALLLVQQPLLPEASSWFLTSLTITYRFAIATLVMAWICAPTIRKLTRLECWEGLGLGVFGSIGLIFQMDGLAYTSASTSAFLTQFYCLLIPLIVAFRDRRWPSRVVVLSCLMVIGGVTVLSDIDWRELKMGRGEIETLIASTIFTAQILWLQRPKFAVNNVDHFTLVMFGVTALVCAPVAWWTAASPGDWIAAYESVPAIGFLGILAVFCTLGAYRLMNRWQPLLTATQAGLLYCLEPVFASSFALFLPALLSTWAAVNYENERLTASLLLGGALITIANALMQLSPARQPSS